MYFGIKIINSIQWGYKTAYWKQNYAFCRSGVTQKFASHKTEEFPGLGAISEIVLSGIV